MIFNSITFIIFFASFFPVYFILKGRYRLMLCLLASYLFYGWWDWRFLSLIMISTGVDYWVGLQLHKTDEELRRKRLVSMSVAVNLGILGLFKYFGFFVGSLQLALESLGIATARLNLELVLPIGISFYTFQTMSYSIDLYRRKIPVERSILTFATFVAFFPQLVAGPIVRAAHFLPQLNSDRKFKWDDIYSGFALILVGYFKKVVVADSLATFVDLVFANPVSYMSITLVVAMLFYAFQIYCDFSGYSDIAIGLARMLGFDFPRNFNLPYFARSFSDFWSRWHISLSSWLRDYLYIPLGGNRDGRLSTFRNLMITMLLGGLWHGAAWHFIVWGGLHGIFLILQRLLQGPLASLSRFLHLPDRVRVSLQIIFVFLAVNFTWIFFRFQTMGDAFSFINVISLLDSFSLSDLEHKFHVGIGLFLILVLHTGEWLSMKVEVGDYIVNKPAFRLIVMTVLIMFIALFGTFEAKQFIYFQF